MSLEIYGLTFKATVNSIDCEVTILDKVNVFPYMGHIPVDRYLVEITNHTNKSIIGSVEVISPKDLISKTT